MTGGKGGSSMTTGDPQILARIGELVCQEIMERASRCS